MKVSELTDEKLAHWVAKAQGWHIVDFPEDNEDERYIWFNSSDIAMCPVNDCVLSEGYRPDINWCQCGELIEEFGIRFWPMQGGGFAACKVTGFSFDGDFIDGPCKTGSTPTIAICRAVVASVYGEEVSDES